MKTLEVRGAEFDDASESNCIGIFVPSLSTSVYRDEVEQLRNWLTAWLWAIDNAAKAKDAPAPHVHAILKLE